MTTPAALSAGFAARDPETIRAVYQRYGGLVYSVSYKLLGDTGLAQDATQQVFLQAWKAAQTVDADRPPTRRAARDQLTLPRASRSGSRSLHGLSEGKATTRAGPPIGSRPLWAGGACSPTNEMFRYRVLDFVCTAPPTICLASHDMEGGLGHVLRRLNKDRRPPPRFSPVGGWLSGRHQGDFKDLFG